MIVTTAEDSYNIFKPNLEPDENDEKKVESEEEEEEEQKMINIAKKMNNLNLKKKPKGKRQKTTH